MNTAGEAFEAAVRVAKLKETVARALLAWEAWVVVLSAGCVVSMVARWAANGFAVVGR